MVGGFGFMKGATIVIDMEDGPTIFLVRVDF